MKLIDLSQPLFDGCPNCPVHPPVRSTILKDHPASGWRVEFLSLANHSGSHVDAPLHKIAGAASLDEMQLERFAGPALIPAITPALEHLEVTSAAPADLTIELFDSISTGTSLKRKNFPA